MARYFRRPTKAPAPRCIRCRLLEELCICEVIRKAAERLKGSVTTRVILVTHAYEKTQVSHTGHLVPELLEGAEQRWCAGRNPAPELGHLLEGGARALVLFPDAGAPCLRPEDSGLSPGLTLVVPDGTWRQARRVAHRHPVISALPRVTLPGLGPARWTVRRSARPLGLCTLEALARALGVLHGDSVREALEEVLVAHDRAIWRARAGAVNVAGTRPHAKREARLEVELQ